MMFRLKTLSAFAVLLGVVAAAGHFILGGLISETLAEDAEDALRRAAMVEEQAIRLDEFALLQKARFTAGNERMVRYMQLGDEGTEELYEQLKRKENYANATTTEELRHLAVYNEPLTYDKIQLEDAAKKIEGERNIDLEPRQRRPVMPDLFMVLDRDGIGVAALGKNRYSWFGKEKANVAERFPVVLKAVSENKAKTDVWDWSWGVSDESQLYRVAIAPIRQSRDDRPAGVVVTGMIIGDGVASRSQRLMAGDASAPSKARDYSTSELAEMPQVIFFRGDRIRGSTFSSQQNAELAQQLFAEKNILGSAEPQKVVTVDVAGDTYKGFVRFFTGEFGDEETATGFVVLTNLTRALEPVGEAQRTLLGVAAGALAIGLILMLFFIQQFIRPAATLEEGITDILAGDKDHVFEVSDRNPVFKSLAQGLNLMSAYLQGKPMPDDDDLGGWGELLGDVNKPTSSKGGSQIHGVQMPGMGGGGSKSTASEDKQSS